MTIDALDPDAARPAASAVLVSMSRQMRTPLNAVLGMTELLRSTSLSREQEVYVDRLQRAASGLLDLLNGVLDISAIDADEDHVAGEATPLAPLRVLVVEDLEDNRDVVTLFLKDTPYRLDTAENGAIAVEKVRADVYDLVLMDIQMPVMDGHQATVAIRQWEGERHLKRTPIVALTADAFRDDIDKALAAGCDAHVTKPITKSALLRTIQKYATSRSD
jgi:CheY-like chemotaxis protein